MSNTDTLLAAVLGYMRKGVRRVGTNADMGANFNIFNIANAGISIHRIWAIVTIAFTGNLYVPFLLFTPAGGGAASAMSVLKVGAIDALDVIHTWSGAQAGVMTNGSMLGHTDPNGVGTETFGGSDILCAPGIISVTNAGGDATGAVDWYIDFTPGDPVAEVTPL